MHSAKVILQALTGHLAGMLSENQKNEAEKAIKLHERAIACLEERRLSGLCKELVTHNGMINKWLTLRNILAVLRARGE